MQRTGVIWTLSKMKQERKGGREKELEVERENKSRVDWRKELHSEKERRMKNYDIQRDSKWMMKNRKWEQERRT